MLVIYRWGRLSTTAECFCSRDVSIVLVGRCCGWDSSVAGVWGICPPWGDIDGPCCDPDIWCGRRLPLGRRSLSLGQIYTEKVDWIHIVINSTKDNVHVQLVQSSDYILWLNAAKFQDCKDENFEFKNIFKAESKILKRHKFSKT